MLYHLNVVFLVLRRLGAKCPTIEVFQEIALFQCRMSFCIHIHSNLPNVVPMATRDIKEVCSGTMDA
jgi:hypothetical protein